MGPEKRKSKQIPYMKSFELEVRARAANDYVVVATPGIIQPFLWRCRKRRKLKKKRNYFSISLGSMFRKMQLSSGDNRGSIRWQNKDSLRLSFLLLLGYWRFSWHSQVYLVWQTRDFFFSIFYLSPSVFVSACYCDDIWRSLELTWWICLRRWNALYYIGYGWVEMVTIHWIEGRTVDF